jgi:hypothetical protein
LLPHAWLPDGTSVYDLLGSGFTLLVDAATLAGAPVHRAFAAVEEAAIRRGIPVVITAVETFDDGTTPSALWEAEAVLVRPDQHVAWRGESAEAAQAALDVAAGWPLPTMDRENEPDQDNQQERRSRVDVVIP